MQYSFGSLFAAAFAWANPLLMQLRVADQQRIARFTDAAPADSGFPFTFRSSMNQEVNLNYLLLNIFLGALCLEVIYRVFEGRNSPIPPKLNAIQRWVATVTPLCAYAWINTHHHWGVSEFWRGFGFAYTISDSGYAHLRWWVAATDVLAGGLLVVLLLVFATNRHYLLIVFVAGFVWANFALWLRWYGWLGFRETLGGGFPFPLKWQGSNDSFEPLAANILIGVIGAYLVYRYSRAQGQAGRRAATS
jgi:hypothetical protein